jgi:uncharacterized repeat protein (TIGR03803 family)
MNHKQCSRFAIRLLGLFTVILALGVAASAEWKEKVLYSFQGGNDGSDPGGGVVFDRQGNLYGVTQAGGPPSCAPIGNYCGTVYELSPPVKQGDPWTKTLLYMFKGKRYNDGEVPDGLIIDQGGNLYGVTAYGGTGGCVLIGVPAGCGTVYELSPPRTKGGKWTYTILYSFKSGKDGYLPGGNLVFDSAGNLYGATDFGGGKGTTCNPYYQYCGTVFELSPPKTKGGKWTEKVLHSFAGGTDGANPNGGLVLNAKGSVYGTTAGGGSTGCQGPGCGTAFELKTPTKTGGAWTEKILHVFTNGDDGAGPNGGLIFDAKGALYGTAGGGGSQGVGVVFRLAEAKQSGPWTETVLHNFAFDKGGRNPWGPVTFDESGNLYGTAHAAAGDKFGGVVFSLKPESHGKWAYAILYNFGGAPDGAYPISALVFDKGGNLYSTTEGGGKGESCQGGCGTVFEVSP